MAYSTEQRRAIARQATQWVVARGERPVFRCTATGDGPEIVAATMTA